MTMMSTQRLGPMMGYRTSGLIWRQTTKTNVHILVKVIGSLHHGATQNTPWCYYNHWLRHEFELLGVSWRHGARDHSILHRPSYWWSFGSSKPRILTVSEIGLLINGECDAMVDTWQDVKLPLNKRQAFKVIHFATNRFLTYDFL